MFEKLCALLLRLYPGGFRRAYGDEAVQLMTDRACHERGVLLRVRLLMDLAIDLGATWLHGWTFNGPLLAPTDGLPRFHIIDIHRPRPAALAAGMLTSVFMFAAFTLLFQPRSVANAPIFLSDRRGAPVPGAGSHQSTQQAFEAISIRRARSGDLRDMRMRVLANGDLHASAVPVLLLVHYAYDLPLNPSPRLIGLPLWRETYDIEAKAPANAVPPGLPEREKRRRTQVMIRGLLAEHFKLAMRVEQKAMPVYALTVARNGPNLQEAAIAEKDCFVDTRDPGSCHSFVAGRGHPLSAGAVTMDDVALHIENWSDLPVVNRTALDGLFTIETEGWRPMRLPPPPPAGAALPFDDLPTIFTVLRKLGLELKEQEATVPVYTVKRIERPAGE